MTKLVIKTLQQKSFCIDIIISESTTVLDLKKAIENQESFSVNMQILIFQGKILEDSSLLFDLKLKDDDFVVMMIKKKASSAVKPISSPSPAEEPVTSIHPNSPPKSLESKTPKNPPVDTLSKSTPLDKEYELEIQTLMEMGGFSREQVLQAMKAAFNNPDRAAEYLFSGNIPQMEGESTSSGLQALSFLRTDPQFQQLKALLLRQPHLLQPLLQQIGRANPRFLQLINENQEEFLSLLEDEEDELHDEGADEDHDYEDEGDIDEDNELDGTDDEEHHDQGMKASGEAIPHTQYIQVSPQEKEAIDRLVDLGFSRDRATEAYLACEKDESLAANYLFDNSNDYEDTENDIHS